MDHDAYFDMLSLVEDADSIEPNAFIAVLTARYGLAHASYIDVFPGAGGMHVRRAYHNYPSGWARTYRQRALHRHDVVLHQGMRSLWPLDWHTLRGSNPESELVFATAESFGIPCVGLTFPQVSRGRSSAMFSVSVDMTPSEWPFYRRHFMRDIQVLATLFHASVETPGADGTPHHVVPELTKRESEVLKWSAAGKSYWEIAKILGVSERTVRFFMTNARQKLDVVTNTQAVATAIWHGLITPV